MGRKRWLLVTGPVGGTLEPCGDAGPGKMAVKYRTRLTDALVIILY